MSNVRADHEPGIRLAVGVCGSGKTFGTRMQVFRAACRIPVIVLDRTHEWVDFPRALAPRVAIVSSVDAARAAVERGSCIVVVRVDAKSIQKEVERACTWVGEKGPNGLRREGTRGICIPEAHRVMPNVGGIVGGSHAIDDAITAWRHANAAIWLDTQRFAKVAYTAVELSEEVRVYACGRRDVSSVADEFASREDRGDLEARLRECAARMREGEPGWFVRLSHTVEPPFELEREKA